MVLSESLPHTLQGRPEFLFWLICSGPEEPQSEVLTAILEKTELLAADGAGNEQVALAQLHGKGGQVDTSRRASQPMMPNVRVITKDKAHAARRTK